MNQNKPDISQVRFIKNVDIGGINPNFPLSDEKRNAQTEYLNKCLNNSPKGFILGKDIAIGRYLLGEHELIMQKSVYHIGFTRKPLWMDEEHENT